MSTDKKPGVQKVQGHNFQAFEATVEAKVPYLFPIKDADNPLTEDEFKAWLIEQFGPGVMATIKSVAPIDVTSLPQEQIDAAIARLKQGK